MTQTNKQARQTCHCFVLNSHFIQPSECKYVLFVCLSVRLQDSFILLHFRNFGRRFFFPHSWGKVELCHPLYDFRGKESKLFFADIANRENWNPRKIIPMFSRQNHENLAMRKYPTIQYHFVAFTMLGVIWATLWENLFMPYANNKGIDQSDQCLCYSLPR